MGDKINWMRVKEEFEKEMAKKLGKLPSHKDVADVSIELRNIISHELPETSPSETYKKLIDLLLSNKPFSIAEIRKMYLDTEIAKEQKALRDNQKQFEQFRESAKTWVLNNLSEDQLQTDWKNHKTWLPRRYLIYNDSNTSFQEITIDTLARFTLIKVIQTKLTKQKMTKAMEIISKTRKKIKPMTSKEIKEMINYGRKY